MHEKKESKKYQKYKFDNALLDYVYAMVELKDILSDVSFKKEDNKNIFYSLLYCHTITIFETFIGDTIRYNQYKAGKDIKEKQSYQNYNVIKKSLKEEFGIDFSLPQDYRNVMVIRNSLIHQNGNKFNGGKINVSKKDVENLIRLVEDITKKINDKLTTKWAENFIE